MYDQITRMVEQNKDTYIGPFFNSIDLEGLTTESGREKHRSQARTSYIALYRAYKYQKILLHPQNWKQIRAIKPSFVSEFYMRLHQAMRKQNPLTNANLAMELVDFFLKNDPDLSTVNILHYNIPFVLLWNVELKCVREILCKLVDLAENIYNLSLTNTIKITRYYRYTDFFLDYVKLIFYSDFVVDFRRCAVNYKPHALHKIYQINQNFISNVVDKSKKPSKQLLLSIGSLTTIKKTYESEDGKQQIAEEKYNLKSDIDRIKPSVSKNKDRSLVNTCSQNIKSQQTRPQQEKRAQSVPRIHLDNAVDRISLQHLGERTGTAESERHSIVPDQLNCSIERGVKTNRMYPSLLDSLLKVEPQTKDKKSPIKSAQKRYMESSFLKRANSRITTSRVGSRGTIGASETNLGEANTGRNSEKPRGNSESSRPGTTSIIGKRRIINTKIDINSAHISFNQANEDEKRLTQKSNMSKLPTVFGKERFTSRPETQDVINLSSLVGSNSVNNMFAMTQSVLNVYALPSKALGKIPRRPKFCSSQLEGISIGNIEGLSQKGFGVDEGSKKNEERAFPLAVCLRNLVQEYFERHSQTEFMKLIGLKDLSHLKVMKALEGSTGITFFSLLFKVYFH